MAHAKLSPSSAFRWTSCTASPRQSDGKPNTSSEAAMQGTAEHQVSAECLESGADPTSYIGRTLLFWSHSESDSSGEDWDAPGVENSLECNLAHVHHRITIAADSAARCSAYVQFVRDLVKARGATLFVEQRLPIGHVTGEEGAKGTSDAVLLAGNELIICDAKFGRGKVNAYEVVKPAVRNNDGLEIEPAVLEPNKQLALYAEGALAEFGWMGSFDSVRMIIVQPALDHVSEYAHSAERHAAFIETLRQSAEQTRSNPQYVPSADNCFFCPGRFDCHARNAEALNLAAGAFEDPDAAPLAVMARTPVDRHLGMLYSKLPFIQRWLADIETRVHDTLAAGGQVVRDDGLSYELVDGREGARQWENEAVAEETLSKMRLGDDIYTRKVISPTAAEKLRKVPKTAPEGTKPRIGDRQWNKLEKLIVRAPAKKVIALRTSAAPTDSSTDLFS